jgi:Tat protein secretion system quality control protein TatD with DNase activity
LVEIGANLASAKFAKNLLPVLTRSARAGVTTVLITGTSLKGSRQGRALTKRWGAGVGTSSAEAGGDTPHVKHGVRLYFTAGIHPHEASKHGDVATTIKGLRESVPVSFAFCTES